MLDCHALATGLNITGYCVVAAEDLHGTLVDR